MPSDASSDKRKGKGKLKEKGKKPNDAVQAELIENAVLRTLPEMLGDLQKVSSDLARQLQDLLKSLSAKEIITELQKPDSALTQVVSNGCRRMGKTGLQYQYIFALVQPNLRVPETRVQTAQEPPSAEEARDTSTAVAVTETVQSKSKKGVKRKRTTTVMQVQSPSHLHVPTPTETVGRLLHNTQDKDVLMSLADSIFQDLALEQQTGGELGMQDMLMLMSKVGGAVQDKVNSGDIDVERLQQQAMSFCEQIKDNPELQNIIQSNPVLAGMQSNVASASSTDSTNEPEVGAATGGLGSMLMGMMSQYQGSM